MKGPAKGTQVKNGRYYLVRAEGSKRVWVPLTKVKEGMPALFLALSKVVDDERTAPDLMPKLIADWERDVGVKHAPKTLKDEQRRGREIAAAFDKFRAQDITPPDVVTFLRDFVETPRTHNLYRSQLRELMRYAEERGFRTPGSNPVTALRTLPTPPRDRYITDSELRRIKVGGIYGHDGNKTRSGFMLAALIDMAHLTGQRIGDLLALEWGQITPDGIAFKQAKTGARVIVEWTPRLQDVVRRLKEMRKARRGFTVKVFTTQDGKPYSYDGFKSAWQRAVERSGVKGVTFHDIRHKAAVETERAQGLSAASRQLGHATEKQTSAYVGKTQAKKARATR